MCSVSTVTMRVQYVTYYVQFVHSYSVSKQNLCGNFTIRGKGVLDIYIKKMLSKGSHLEQPSNPT